MNFIRELENELHHNNHEEDDGIGGGGISGNGGNRSKGGKIQPPSFDPVSKGGDFFDV